MCKLRVTSYKFRSERIWLLNYDNIKLSKKKLASKIISCSCETEIYKIPENG